MVVSTVYQGVRQDLDEYRDFSWTLKQGVTDEANVREFVAQQGFEVIDRSDNEEYRKKDIDFEFIQNNQCIGVEVKSDNQMHRTGNIAVELAMDRGIKTTNGWYHYCEADLLCFFDTVQGVAYFIYWKALKQAIQEHRWRFKSFANKIDDCTGFLCLIPVKDLFEQGFIYWSGAIGA